MNAGPPPRITAVSSRLRPALSVVAPCYDEGAALAAFYDRVSKVCLAQVGQDYEIVLVNDGSRDDTLAKIHALASRDPHVVGVDLSRNFGHQRALSAGLAAARGQRILILDADLQDPPELLPTMMEVLDAGADVAYGVRTERKGESLFKRASAAAFYRLLALLSDTPIPLDSGDFRLMSRRVTDVVNAMPEQGRFLRGMIAWAGFEQKPVAYSRAPRSTGKTKFPLHRMVLFSLDAITAFSIRPLRAALMLGAGFGVCGLMVLVYALASWASGGTVAGWTSVMAALLILGSSQLFVLGLIGEYVGRLVAESKQRPLYVVRSVVGGAFSGPTVTSAEEALD